MGDVYRNAYLMVAAANASDDAQGFLKLRPKIQCSMKVVGPTGQTASVYLWPQQHSYDDVHSALHSRGWTLQESYLCRRQIQFENKKIRWHCQSAQWDESNRDEFKKRYQGGTSLSITHLLPGMMPYHSNPYQE